METELNFCGNKIRPAKSECEKYKHFSDMNKQLQDLNLLIKSLPDSEKDIYLPLLLKGKLEEAAELMKNNLAYGVSMLEKDYNSKKIEFSLFYNSPKLHGEITGFSHWGTYAPIFKVRCYENPQGIYTVMLGDFVFSENNF